MSEVIRKVTPYEYNYLCDQCKNGMVRVNGEKDSTGKYPHQCMICGAEATLNKSYPHVEYFGEGEKPA